MKHEDKVKLALGAQKRITDQFARLAEDTVLKDSMREATQRLRDMKDPKPAKRA